MLARSICTASVLASVVFSQSLDSVLIEHDDLSSFREMLSEYPELLSDLDADGDVTILAPSNNALSEHSDAIESGTVGNESVPLRHMLNYHVLNGRFHTDDIPAEGAFIPTFLRDERFSAIRHGQVVFALPSHSETDQVSGFFEFYSGWNNRSATANEDSSLLNIEFDGGLIHVISAPLTVPPSVGELSFFHQDTYMYSAYHSSLGAVQDNSAGGDMTFFVPTNEAFREIYSEIQSRFDAQEEAFTNDSGDLDEAQSDFENFTQNLWLYHFINDTTPIYSSRIDHADWITALRRNVTFNVEENGTTWVNNARIIEANWLVSNGVVHIIDQVLNPENTEAPPPTGEPSGTVAFDVDGPVETGLATFRPSGFPELPDPPEATPTWDSERAEGLAVGSDDEGDVGHGDEEEESVGGPENGENEEGTEAAASSMGIKMPIVFAGLIFWTCMIML